LLMHALSPGTYGGCNTAWHALAAIRCVYV
jgi:hypothetical protein